MGLTWDDQPARSHFVLTRGRERIIDIRTPSDQRRTTPPDPAQAVAIRWTVLGLRCSIELARVGRDGASRDPEPVRSRP